MFAVKRILVPVDFSPVSDRALTHAADLADVHGARVLLLHVPGRTGESFEADFPFGPFETSSATRALMAGVQSEDRKPEFAVRLGAAAEEITRYARDRDIDLIVMGTHGRTGLSHAVLGSVAERVIREAGCPVMVVRHPG